MRDSSSLDHCLSSHQPSTMRTRLAANKNRARANALASKKEPGSCRGCVVVRVVLDHSVHARIVDKSRKRRSSISPSNDSSDKGFRRQDETEPLSKMRKKNEHTGVIAAILKKSVRLESSSKLKKPEKLKSVSKSEKTTLSPILGKQKLQLKSFRAEISTPSRASDKQKLGAKQPKWEKTNSKTPSPKEAKRVSSKKMPMLLPKSEKSVSGLHSNSESQVSTFFQIPESETTTSTFSLRGSAVKDREISILKTSVKIEDNNTEDTDGHGDQATSSAGTDSICVEECKISLSDSEEGNNSTLTVEDVGPEEDGDEEQEDEEVNVDFLDEFDMDIRKTQTNGSISSEKDGKDGINDKSQDDEDQLDRLTIDETSSTSDKVEQQPTSATSTTIMDESLPSRTVRVQTPVFLDKENVKEVVRSLYKLIDEPCLRRVYLSHFFFMEFADTISCQKWKNSPNSEVANELTYYCAECAFAREAQVQEHWAHCRSDENRELNKFAKLFIYALPDFSHVAERQVLVVRRFRSVALDELETLFGSIEGLTNVTFARSLFMEMDNRSSATAAAKAINNTKLQGMPEANLPTIEAQLITQTPGYRSLGVTEGQKEDKSAAIRSMRHTLAQTLYTHELRSELSLSRQCVLMLGQSMRIVIKGSSNKYVEWIKRLLGPDCSRVVSGELANQEAGNKSGRIKNNPMADFSVYGVAFFSSQEAARSAIKNCQMHFLLKHHLNVLNLESFLSVLRPRQTSTVKKVSTVRRDSGKRNKEKKAKTSATKTTTATTSTPSVDYRLSLEFGDSPCGGANVKTTGERGRSRLFSSDHVKNATTTLTVNNALTEKSDNWMDPYGC